MPTPSGSNDVFNLDYRVKRLEEWQKEIEREGVAKTLAVMDERMAGMAIRLLATEKKVEEHDDDLNQRRGFSGGVKTWLAVGAGTLLLAGSFLLQLASALGGAQ